MKILKNKIAEEKEAPKKQLKESKKGGKCTISEAALKKVISGILMEEKTGKKVFKFKNEKEKQFVESLRKTIKGDKTLNEMIKKSKKVIK